ncbi:MAG: RNA 2',3'-cyclic phosphodiesterase [Desulfobacteraceae bacterium]|nr:MAG: RNA 2',3'-cyclic phosphodiesterase [Desulfobacteraceae bacterium]
MSTGQSNRIRAFIAIDLPAQVITDLDQLQQQIRRNLDIKASWPRPRNIHLTLKFLGSIPMGQINAVIQAMTQARDQLNSRAIQLSCGGIGVFPSVKRPKVLWAGLRKDTHLLGEMHQHLNAGLSPLGFTPESRRFSPHLTLARIKKSSISAKRWIRLIQEYGDFETRSFQVDSIKLFKSELTPSGAVYSTLSVLNL